jgi:hypothetical protein
MARLLVVLLSILLMPAAASAQLMPKPDDTLSLSLSAEDWVSTKTARTVINVNAAVSSDNAGSTRDAMLKAVQQLAEGQWRVTSFNRSQTDTGLESWFAQFEARLPESSLGGLNEKATKLSKPGMQLNVGQIDFSPTLEETEAVKTSLRKQLMDKVNAELKAVNAAFPGRDFRVSEISFGGVQGFNAMRQRLMTMKGAHGEMAAAAPMAPMAMDNSMGGGMETAQKLTQTATVTIAALAPVSPSAPAPAKEASAR